MSRLILQHFKINTFNFSKMIFFIFALANCILAVSCESVTEHVISMDAEGTCIHPPTNTMLSPEILAKLSENGAIYFPMGSMYGIIELAELMLARNLTNHDDLSQLCIRFKYNPLSHTEGQGLFTGEGAHWVTAECTESMMTMTDVGHKNCTLMSHFPGHPHELLTLAFTMTDGKSYIVATVCWETENQKSWLVFANKPKLSDEDNQAILKYVDSIGFQSSHAIHVEYEHCKC